MDGRRAGAIVRGVRIQLRLRQEDVANRAGLSQRWVSELELGRISSLSTDAIEKICAALGVRVRLDLWWPGGNVDRLLDQDHAAIVEYVVGVLRRHDWEVRLEFGFNNFGERGSVDILAWHAASRTLLLIEVKSRLVDLQDTLAALARKVRIVPTLAGAEGWSPERTAYALVVLGTTANKRVVDRHPQIFEATFADQSVAVRSWLRRPDDRALCGLWFVEPRSVGDARRRERVRRAA